MARKAKKSSCQVEHWWEEHVKGKWLHSSDNTLCCLIRHMIEVHYLKRFVRIGDLRELNTSIFRMLGLAIMLKIRFRSSPYLAVRHAYPEFFGWSRPDHLHEWDFMKNGMWKNQKFDDQDRIAIRHMVEEHYLGRTARSDDLVKLDYSLFKQLELGGLLQQERFRSSPYLAIRHAYPEFFDWSRPDHLHEWDFTQYNMWGCKTGSALAYTAIRHMIEVHYLKRFACPKDLRLIDRRILLRLELGSMLSARFNSSPAAAVRHAYPEFFDWSRPDHLHEWDFTQQRMWRNSRSTALARTTIRHTIETHHLGRATRSDDLDKITQGWFLQVGLSGLLTAMFHGSPLAALRHAYPEFAEAIGRRIKGTADFVGVLEAEDPKRASKLLRDLMSHFGDDLVDVADILAVVYTGRLDSSTAMEILQDPSMRPWIVPFDGRGHGPGKPPIGDDFPFYLLEKDRNGIIAGIIRRRLTEWRRKVLGARPSKEARAKFLRQLRELQDKFRAKGGKEVAPAAA